MTTPSTPPAVYGQFGMALAFAERTLTGILHDHLAERGTAPETWYALHLVGARGPGMARDALTRDLEGSRNVPAGSTAALLARLEAEGLIEGDATVDLTAEGEARYRDLRAYVGAPTARLLDQFDLADLETTVRTVLAVTQRAAEEADQADQAEQARQRADLS